MASSENKKIFANLSSVTFSNFERKNKNVHFCIRLSQTIVLHIFEQFRNNLFWDEMFKKPRSTLFDLLTVNILQISSWILSQQKSK